MKQVYGLLCIIPAVVNAQSIELKPVDIIYGNQMIRTEHQIVVSSPDEVAIIPVEEIKEIGPNIVIPAEGSSRLSSFEANSIAEREQEIYEEVNKRTKEAPFTVLFTGNIPDIIQDRRLRMMPEIELIEDTGGGGFGSPDEGDFTSVGADDNGAISSGPISEEDAAKLEQLIGG